MKTKNGKSIFLEQNETVIAVVPEYCSVPGWSNKLVLVHIVNWFTNKHRVEYLQPEEQSSDMLKNFKVIQAAHELAINSVLIKDET